MIKNTTPYIGKIRLKFESEIDQNIIEEFQRLMVYSKK